MSTNTDRKEVAEMNALYTLDEEVHYTTLSQNGYLNAVCGGCVTSVAYKNVEKSLGRIYTTVKNGNIVLNAATIQYPDVEEVNAALLVSRKPN